VRVDAEQTMDLRRVNPGVVRSDVATGVNRHQSFRLGRSDPGTPMDLTGFTFSMLGFVLNSLGAMGSGMTQANYRKIGQSSKYGPTNYRDKK
jgi:hypothetical protein